MPDNSPERLSTSVTQGQAGSPLVTATSTTTATTLAPQPEPWWPHVSFEAGGLLAGLIAVVVWVENRIEKRRREDKDRDKLEDENIIRQVADNAHKLGNERARIDALELSRDKDIERIVKLETNQANIEKGQDEIKRDMKDGFRDMKREILDAIYGRNEVIDTQIANVVESLRVMRGDYHGGKDKS